MSDELEWKGGPGEYIGYRGKWMIARISRDGDAWGLYDLRWLNNDQGELEADGISLADAMERVKDW